MGREREFRPATPIERLFNRTFGFFVGLGLSPSYSYLLEVRGRKSGRLYSIPVNLHEFRGRQFLVAPRGRTEWVRNAEVTGEVTLKKRRERRRFRLRPLANAEKPEILKSYLGRYRGAVERFFPLSPEASLRDFEKISPDYPAFELSAE
jgi:deazaflavin-dependent oxidoreductase (nitroreductase family)